MVEDLSISYRLTQYILVNVLGKKFLFWKPNVEERAQKRCLTEIHTFIKRLITDAKIQVYEYDVETVSQSGERHSKNKTKPKYPNFAESTLGYTSRGLWKVYGKLE